MTFEQAQNETNGQYKIVSGLVEEYLILHKGEDFDLDTICRQLSILERSNRKYASIDTGVSETKIERRNCSRAEAAST